MSVVPFEDVSLPDMDRVKAATGRIQLRMKRTAEDIVEIGLDLIEIKDCLPHGGFLPWIEAEFGMSDRTARRFVDVAKVYGTRLDPVSNLSPKVLYELSAPSTPEPVRQVIEAKAEQGETVSVKEVQDLKRRMKEQQEADEKRVADISARADSLSAENQALKDSQELARIKAHEEAKKAAEAEQAALQKKVAELEGQVATAKKEAKAAASKEAEAILRKKMAQKEDELKKLRQKARDAERQVESLESRRQRIKKDVDSLRDQANKASSLEWEAKALEEELGELGQKLTMVMLTVQGLEHQHTGKTLSVAHQISSMCENLATALKLVPQIGADR